MLNLQNIGFRRGDKWILKELTHSFEKGQFWGFIGPNGAGKSTLLRMLSGDLQPSQGSITLENKELSTYSAQALARKRSFLTQKSTLNFPFTVQEVVEFGQFSQLRSNEVPTSNAFSFSPHQAMSSTQVEHLAQRMYPTLSGGEACRVDVARVLTQETPILLLDEPTNHLDPRHQVTLLQLMAELTERGALVVAALHDLNLAAQYCSHLLLLQGGQTVAHGSPEHVLCPKRLEETYQIPFDIHQVTTSDTHEKRPLVLPRYARSFGDSHHIHSEMGST